MKACWPSARSARTWIAPEKPARFAAPAASAADVEELKGLLAKAKRPVMIIGGPGWSREIQRKVEAFAERYDMPVAAAFRFQDYMDNRHPNYVGEVSFWLGLALFGLAAAPGAWWWVFAGTVLMLAMFLGASIPMMEKRSLERRPAYQDVVDRVSLFLPRPPRKSA